MTLLESGQNGRYETDHLHIFLNDDIEFSEEGLSDDRKYSIFVHEYVHYYQHFATLYGIQFCKMSNLLFIQSRAFLSEAKEIELPFGIWEHHTGIASYLKRKSDVCGSINCSHIVGDIEIDDREIQMAKECMKAVKIGVYDYTEDEAYEDGFRFGYLCIIEGMAHLIQKMIWPEVRHNQIPYEAVEIMCRYKYPEIADDPKEMITVCMCALMFDNPGQGFFSVIEFAKEHSDLQGVDLFKEFIQTSCVCYKSHRSSMDYMGQDILAEYKTALQTMCGCTLEYYDKVVDSFIHDFQTGTCGLLSWLYEGDVRDRLQFMALVNAYGLPYIESPQCSIMPKNNATGRPYIDTAALVGFELIFRRLQNKDGDVCPMYRICKQNRLNEESKVDEYCAKEQWKKDTACLMVQALKYYGLKDKQYNSRELFINVPLLTGD